MPKWVHDRADHLRAKNPDMPKSMAFAIATQQGEATGHTPKGFGTAEGLRMAKAKYRSPQNDAQAADPGSKEASIGAVALRVVGPTGILEKLGFANSAYAGQPAQNGPGMKGRSQIPPFVAPPIEVKEAAGVGPLHRIGEYITGSRQKRLRQAGLQHFEKALAARDARPRHDIAVLTTLVAAKKLKAHGIQQGPGAIHPDDLVDHLRKKRAKLPGTIAHEDKAKWKLLRLAEHEGAKRALAGTLAADTAAVGGLALAHKHRSSLRRQQKEAGVGVGAGMSASQYSGPLSYGPFKQTSQIPGFVSPGMTKTDPSLEPGGVKAAAAATGAMSPAAKLSTSQRVGAPKTTGFSGPSIADIAKPKGYGMPLAGAGKNAI